MGGADRARLHGHFYLLSEMCRLPRISQSSDRVQDLCNNKHKFVCDKFDSIRRTFSNIVIIKKMLKLIICAKKCIFTIKDRTKYSNIYLLEYFGLSFIVKIHFLAQMIHFNIFLIIVCDKVLLRQPTQPTQTVQFESVLRGECRGFLPRKTVHSKAPTKKKNHIKISTEMVVHGSC